MGFVDTYLWHLEQDPLSVKIVSAFIQMALADFICQQINNAFKPVRIFSLDLQRWLTMCIWSACLQTPIQHWYYVTFLNESNGVPINVAIDQIIWTPIINGLFLYYNGCMNGKDALRALKYVKNNLLNLYKSSCCVWPIVLYIQLNFFTLHTGFIFNLFVGLFWSIVLSFLQNSYQQKASKLDVQKQG